MLKARPPSSVLGDPDVPPARESPRSTASAEPAGPRADQTSAQRNSPGSPKSWHDFGRCPIYIAITWLLDNYYVVIT